MPSGVEQTEDGNTRVWHSLKATVNMGDYNSITVDLGASTDVLEDETVSEALEDLYGTVKDALAAHLEDLQETLSHE